MSMVDLPGLKHVLWHKMRDDLKSSVPWFNDNDLLLCPCCCRPLQFEDFSVEHIIPQQAVAGDPLEVRATIPQNARSGITLLCRKAIVFKGKSASKSGCNSWKGKFYDTCLRDLVQSGINSKRMTEQHQVALFSAGYLGLFQKFGYQVALSPSGVLMRRQFFNPRSFLKDIPISCQMMLTGDRLSNLDEGTRPYWADPFQITVDKDTALIVVRNISFRLPLSRDPTVPFARVLPYAPQKYVFRPDLRPMFG